MQSSGGIGHLTHEDEADMLPLWIASIVLSGVGIWVHNAVWQGERI